MSHEIDVLIKKDQAIAMVECKFHASTNAASDVKVPLYIHSRLMISKRKNTLFFLITILFLNAGLLPIIDLQVMQLLTQNVLL